jgi:hypothetical protein
VVIAHGAQAAERELRWDALYVEAHLDADGVLDVIERHTMVFTGDWNGGERVSNVRARQKLEFLGVQRIDASLPSRWFQVIFGAERIGFRKSRKLNRLQFRSQVRRAITVEPNPRFVGKTTNTSPLVCAAPKTSIFSCSSLC